MEKLLTLRVPGPSGIVDITPTGIPSRTTELSTVLSWIVSIILLGLIFLSLGYTLYGGFMWITSQGDKQKIQSARNGITYAIIGLIVALLSFFIVSFFGKFLGIDLLNVTL